MEKKYVVGYLYGRERVMWDDVKDFSETLDTETGMTVVRFKEGNTEYVYRGTERRGFNEDNNLAPFITSYKLMGRRTAIRHDYLNQPRQEAPAGRTYTHEYEDPERYRAVYSGCGSSGCGGSDPDYYEPRGCGSLGCGHSGYYYRNTGCGGGYYRCGGGGGGC